jgi:hypothetical protein
MITYKTSNLYATGKLVFLVLIMVTILGSKGCNGTFEVDYPKTSADFKIVNKKIVITVKFDRDVEFTSVIPKKTFKVDAEKDHNADGTIKKVGLREVEWISTKDIVNLLDYDPDGEFYLILIGTDVGDGVIKDVKGNVLDGDADGNAGGDFKLLLVHVG